LFPISERTTNLSKSCFPDPAEAVNTLAIDVGGTKFTLALYEDQRMTRRESRVTDRNGGRAWMVAQIEALVLAWKREVAIDRCGIGFGGPVNFDRQQVALSTHVGGWQGFPLSQYVQDLLGAPTVMDNDANAGALGESLYGAGAGSRPLFYMTLSTGIGGGIVLEDGTVFRGADSWAGEIGHLTIQPGGPECLCGSHGCLERLCSGLWLERDYGRPARDLFEDAAFVERLAKLPNLGRPGRVARTRELVGPGAPYVIPYRLRGDRLEVVGRRQARRDHSGLRSTRPVAAAVAGLSRAR